MSRTIVDEELREWEAFASAARGGAATPGRIVFRPLAPAGGSALVTEIDGRGARAEALVARASDAELRALLRAARPLR